jgi:hypothetical protein
LAKEYQLDDKAGEVMWPLLALRLAEQHEPGFIVVEKPPTEPKRGRPRKANSNFLIYLEIERMRASAAGEGKQLAIRQACVELKKNCGSTGAGPNSVEPRCLA